MIDLMSDVEPGEYPPLDLYKKHGKIVFQLYAACLGCYFTTHRSSIKGVGYETFIFVTDKVGETLNATTLANSLWGHKKIS